MDTKHVYNQEKGEKKKWKEQVDANLLWGTKKKKQTATIIVQNNVTPYRKISAGNLD